jgi:hypothetical protein
MSQTIAIFKLFVFFVAFYKFSVGCISQRFIGLIACKRKGCFVLIGIAEKVVN